MGYQIDRVFVDVEVGNSPLTRNVVAKVHPENVIVGNAGELKAMMADLSLRDGKRSLFLTKSNGRYLKKCPGMIPPYLCCNLHVLNASSNCPMSCSYCFLQFYLNNPAVTIFADFSAMKSQVESAAASRPELLLRVTTGELSDSLAFDNETNLSPRLIGVFKDIPNAVLELKTKTAFVNHLLPLSHGGRTILSWSLNPEHVIRRDEKGSASLRMRIQAAQEAATAGYRLAFHFDPLLFYDGWERDYEQTVKLLFEHVSAKHVAWVSLGSLRFAPGTEHHIAEGYPRSNLPYGEMVVSLCGKMRYAKPIRIEQYTRMVEWLGRYANDTLFVYLCMEMPQTWQKVMGFQPRSVAHLDYLFADGLYARFPELVAQKPVRKDYEKGCSTEG